MGSESKFDKLGRVSAKLYKGAPCVELQDDDQIAVNLKLNRELSDKIVNASAKGEPVSISLASLDIDMQHNQSYGMIAASTGCISNPGGPGC